MYGKLYSMCGYSQSAETSNEHFLSSNNANYYAPEQFYEKAKHIKKLNLFSPNQLKFGSKNKVDEDAIFQLADNTKQTSCRSCGTRGTIRESYMQGSKKHEPGSKTVVNCTSCYSGQGKYAIPVTNVDTSDVRLADEIYNNPGVCNNPTSTLSQPSNTSDFGWKFSRWNKTKENYEQEEKSGLDKSEWGKAGWKLLHAATFGYPENPSLEKQFAMWNFLHSLSCALPCGTCEKECKSYVNKNPPPVDNAKELQLWGYHFHEAVNARLGKPSFSWEKTKNYHKSKQNMCSS